VLLVVAAVGAMRLDEAVTLVERLRSGGGRECPEPEAVGTLALGQAEELRTDAASGQRRLDV
jgi:hypothetical protein